MKKVGIITLNGNFNYGNRLQNYALQQVLKNLNVFSETIIFDDTHSVNKTMEIIYKIKYKLIRLIKNDSKIVLNWEKMKAAKGKVFQPFTEKNIKSIYINRDMEISAKFDYFIVGSDQVWNPNIIKNDTHYFLDFTSKQKRIAYAASFGVPKLSHISTPFRDGLLGMNEVSVRENSGADIVKQVTGREPQVVVDPTMLLSAKQWNHLIHQYSDELDIKGKYILIYFLRDKNEKLYRDIEIYAKSKNFRIYNIMGDSYSEKKIIPDPLQFISLIEKAEFVLSDSFHCAVFSIIMKTPFVIMDRNSGNMNSRILTLLSKFNLKSNRYNNKIKFEYIRQNTDFSNVDNILNEEKKVGLLFLKNALNCRV